VYVCPGGVARIDSAQKMPALFFLEQAEDLVSELESLSMVQTDRQLDLRAIARQRTVRFSFWGRLILDAVLASVSGLVQCPCTLEDLNIPLPRASSSSTAKKRQIILPTPPLVPLGSRRTITRAGAPSARTRGQDRPHRLLFQVRRRMQLRPGLSERAETTPSGATWRSGDI